jgi:hypothetical protein
VRILGSHHLDGGLIFVFSKSLAVWPLAEVKLRKPVRYNLPRIIISSPLVAEAKFSSLDGYY